MYSLEWGTSALSKHPAAPRNAWGTSMRYVGFRHPRPGLPNLVSRAGSSTARPPPPLSSPRSQSPSSSTTSREGEEQQSGRSTDSLIKEYPTFIHKQVNNCVQHAPDATCRSPNQFPVPGFQQEKVNAQATCRWPNHSVMSLWLCPC